MKTLDVQRKIYIKDNLHELTTFYKCRIDVKKEFCVETNFSVKLKYDAL